jgi:hypothetical protein
MPWGDGNDGERLSALRSGIDGISGVRGFDTGFQEVVDIGGYLLSRRMSRARFSRRNNGL